ncbi:MAG: twin-arginine translocation signal domain-containing protein [Brucellaceae bacterium]|nr:twin-arginine translocation signal domain-containing protein [Brucellaceae bacterium]
MSRTDKPADESRRNFMKLAATAAPAAAVVAVTGQEAEAAEAEVKTSGLRKTAHVKAYLDSARF